MSLWRGGWLCLPRRRPPLFSGALSSCGKASADPSRRSRACTDTKMELLGTAKGTQAFYWSAWDLVYLVWCEGGVMRGVTPRRRGDTALPAHPMLYGCLNALRKDAWGAHLVLARTSRPVVCAGCQELGPAKRWVGQGGPRERREARGVWTD